METLQQNNSDSELKKLDEKLKNLQSLQEEMVHRIEAALTYKQYPKWVKDYWTSRGKPLDFEDHKYLVQIYQDQSPDIRFQKSAQQGVTERLVTEAIWLADQFKENALYLFPTSGTMSELVQERVDEPINNNQYLLGVVGRVKRMFKHADKTSLKRMSRGFVYFRGSNKPTQITSVAADAIFVDELDRMEQESVPYFEKRMEHSLRKWQRWASTPTIPGFGIHKLFLESDQHEYFVRCNHCSELQNLTFQENIVYSMKGEQVEKADVICKKCRRVIVPYKLEGIWVPKERASNVRGYFISQLYSPRMEPIKLVRASLRPAEFEVQQFYNQNLGLPYEAKGARLTEDTIKSCIRNYTLPMVPRIKNSDDEWEKEDEVIGVDVGRVLHVITRTAEKITDIRTIQHFFHDDGSDNLEDYINARDAKKIVVDAMPETRQVQKLIGKFPGRVYMCRYTRVQDIMSETQQEDDEEDDGDSQRYYRIKESEVQTDRTISLDIMYSKLFKQKIQLPKNIDGYQEYKDHLKALVRYQEKAKDGNYKVEYKEVSADHYAHAQNYADIAMHLFDYDFIPSVITIG